MANTHPPEIATPLRAAFETFARQSGVHQVALGKFPSGAYVAPPIQQEYEQFCAAVVRCIELVRAYEDSAGRNDDIADYLQRTTAQELQEPSARAGLQAVCEAVAKIDWTRIDEKLGEGADQLEAMLLGAPAKSERNNPHAEVSEPTPVSRTYSRDRRHVIPDGVPQGNVFETRAAGEVMHNPRAWRCAWAHVSPSFACIELLTFQQAQGLVGQEHSERFSFYDLVASGVCDPEAAHDILDRWGTSGEIPERFKLSRRQQELLDIKNAAADKGSDADEKGRISFSVPKNRAGGAVQSQDLVYDFRGNVTGAEGCISREESVDTGCVESLAQQRPRGG